MCHNDSAREQVIWSELERDMAEFEQAKVEFERARARYEVARDRLIATKRLASQSVSPSGIAGGLSRYPAVKYFGLPVGEAIVAVLGEHVIEQAKIFAEEIPDWYEPEMALNDIVKALEQGGFEFRSAAPMREVNAALINLKGVKKSGLGYTREDHERLAQFCMAVQGGKEEESD